MGERGEDTPTTALTAPQMPATAAAGGSRGALEVLPGDVKVSRLHGALQLSVRERTGLSRWSKVFGETTVLSFVLFFYQPWAAHSLLGAVLPTGIALGLFYELASTLFNVTKISADRRKIAVTDGPIRLFNRSAVHPVEHIDQIFVSRDEVKKKSRSVVYSLKASFVDGETVDLLSDLQSPTQALVCKRLLEQELGLAEEDTPTPNASGE